MKRFFRVLGLLFIVVVLQAKWIAINDENSGLFQCNSGNLREIIVDFNLLGYETEIINVDGEKYTKISLKNEAQFLDVGKPDLPRFSRLVAIPNGGEVSFDVISSEEDEISNLKIYPVQSLKSESVKNDNEFVINEDYYLAGGIFPKEIVQIGKPAIMRDYRVVRLTINPFQYDAKAKKMIIRKKIKLKIKTTGYGGENIKTRQRNTISHTFQNIYKATIINYEQIKEREADFQIPSYLFIYPNDSSVQSNLAQLTDWKHMKGFEVTSVSTSTTGTSTTSIKNYIQNAYDTWTNPPEFICLIGDAGGSFNIPTFTESWSGYSGEGDHPYAQLEGNDILADAFLGRMSFNTIYEFQTELSKVMNYEKNPYTGSTNWFRKTLLVGDPSTSGPSCVDTKKTVKEDIVRSGTTMNFDELYSGSYVSGISSSINSGVSYFNYRGWYGMSGWDNSDTDNLNNGYMLPIATVITCGTGSFAGTYDAISEYFFKVGSPSVPKGAVAAIGTATTGTHTTFNNCLDIGIYYGIFNDHIYNMGGALTRGKLNLYNNFPDNPHNKVDIFSYWNNLMGDPGMEVWTDIPSIFNVTFDTQVSIGANNFYISVKNSANIPVQDAWVTLLKGNDEIFASAYTDGDGIVVIPINPTSTGNISVVVSKHNYKPYLGSASVVNSGNFVNVYNYFIDDDNNGSSQGNGDGIINPGETIELKVSLKNYNSSPFYGVNSRLMSSSDITISDANEYYGTLNTNQSTYSSDDFDFSVPASMLGGAEIYLDFNITDNASHDWTDRLILPVSGAHMTYIETNSSTDKGSSLIPGSSSVLSVVLKNTGSLNISNLSGVLSCSNAHITISDANGYFGSVNSGAQAENTSNRFTVEADNQVIPGSQIQFELRLTTPSGYDNTLQYLLTVGTVHVTDPLGPDVYGYYCYDDGDTQYDLAPYYQWIEIDPSYGGSGTVLSLSDPGDDGDIQTVSIPFNVNFYGKPYHTATICSNGWLSFSTTSQNTFMNWEIPGPGGPSTMIAPFWDDLRTSGGHVCYYTPANNEYFIVEWSHLSNDYDGSEETFQVIIYNTSFHPTSTNDSNIKVQYKVVHNTDQGSYSGSYVDHGEYCTIGIEDNTSAKGLEYTFSNHYPDAAKTLTNNMAILFTTNEPVIMAPPEINIDHTSFDIAMLQNQTQNLNFTIENTGQADLVYNITTDYQTNVPVILRDTGGPDTYGYSWKDSNEPNGPIYEWIEISSYGTMLSLSDDSSQNVALPFNFAFYGENKSSVSISSNGYLTFGSSGSDYSNNPIPDNQEPNDFIAPYWDDLKPIGGTWGDVYYYSDTANNRFIVEFDQVSHWTGSDPRDPETFEVILYPNGKIKYQYKVTTSESDTTIGIENSTGTDGLGVVYYNGSYLQDNLAIEFQHSIQWANISPVTGTVASSNSDEIIITLDTSELALGNYLCNVLVNSNDPLNDQITIPVNLEVVDQLLNAPQNVTINESGGQFTLHWDAVSGASGYKIYSSATVNGTFVYLTTVSTSSYQFSATSSKKFYKIIAIN